MKKSILGICVAGLMVLGFTSMTEPAPPTISGKITPAEGVDAVWAIQATDSVKATISSEGAFQLEVKPGTWKLVVSAKAPYKNSEINNLEVAEDKNADLGEIKLNQ